MAAAGERLEPPGYSYAVFHFGICYPLDRTLQEDKVLQVSAGASYHMIRHAALLKHGARGSCACEVQR